MVGRFGVSEVIYLQRLSIRTLCRGYLSELFAKVIYQNYLQRLSIRTICRGYLSELFAQKLNCGSMGTNCFPKHFKSVVNSWSTLKLLQGNLWPRYTKPSPTLITGDLTYWIETVYTQENHDQWNTISVHMRSPILTEIVFAQVNHIHSCASTLLDLYETCSHNQKLKIHY